MNIRRFNEALELALRPAAEPLEGAQVWRFPEPVPLAPLLEQALEGEEELEDYSNTFETWPDNVQELLDAHGIHRSLLTMSWDGFGPISWTCGFASLDIGGRSYLCFWDENESYRLLAAASPAGASAALRQLVSDAIASGAFIRFVAQEITNEAPELLERAELEEAFARLLDLTDGWSGLAEDYYARVVEPNPLERSLDLLKRIGEMSDGELDTWLRGEDGPAVPVEKRRGFLRECFDQAYEGLDARS